MNLSSLPLSASVSLTVSDKLVVALLQSLVSRAFPALVVAGGSSSSFWDWTSSLPVLSPPHSQSRAVVAPVVAGDRSSRSPDFLLDFLRTTWSQFDEFQQFFCSFLFCFIAVFDYFFLLKI
ncbi:hypothetical protein AHAS_Ahas17G0144300 [Arachis hypogaea]